MYVNKRLKINKIVVHNTCVVYITHKYKLYHVATPPLECIPASDSQGKLYFGTHNFAKNGDQCQRWDSQTPHKHSVSALSDQDNYCRSADNEKWPWCYTTNPDKRWDYCNIPAC